MNLRRNSHYTAEVYTGSLNDIMFFLLLFFLIISTLVNPSVIKLMLPNTQKAQSTVSKGTVTLSMNKDKQFFINNAEIPFTNLETELTNLTKTITDATIILRVDNSLTVQDLVDVLQIGNKIKVKMVLATKANSK